MNRRHFFKLLPALGTVCMVAPLPQYKYAGRPEKMPNDWGWLIDICPGNGYGWKIETLPGKCAFIVNHDSPEEMFEAVNFYATMKRRYPQAKLTIEKVRTMRHS